jgi:hypothetical protein
MVDVVDPVVEPTTIITQDPNAEPVAPVEPEVSDPDKADAPSDANADKDAPVYDFTVPEGMEVNKPMMDEFTEIAKELKLAPEVGQKLVDLQTKAEQERVDTQNKAWTDLQTSWMDATKSDKEYGGAELNDNMAIARKTLDTFGTPELKEMLDFTGAGNNPEIVRLFYRIGKAISDDNLVMSGKNVAAEKDQASIMFPNDN